MTSMKVAIDSAPLTGGHGVRGVGTYTRELTQELEKLKGEDSLIIESVDFRKTDLSKFDIVHYPYFDLFFHTLPIQKSARTVVTIYDVIPLIYPKHYPSGIRGKVNFFLQKYSLKNVDAIITDSETSKKDIARLLGVPNNLAISFFEVSESVIIASTFFREYFCRKKFTFPLIPDG